MDVRQFAFLARQPSAALKNREHFLGLPKRGLAFILANAMFWQPLLAQADGIVVNAPGTTLGQAGNGVPIVNIAAPNAQGLSHNQFSDYNVGANGVILNNATARTQSTQLGGIILGNQNLNGTAANVILNEVNGGSPSQLRGYTEVAGQSAHVIVANPYGISCNGCGFINTPQATLTTGKVVITNGQVTGYQVDQGSVSIDGAGLNASNIDQFEIITRAATINAQINANQLTVIAGRNDVDARTLQATARADDGSTKPQVAIDSSVLGGMYAGAIKLVGTEAGVGVKLAGNLAASGGDIQLDANGQLSMVQATASGAVNVKAASLDAQGPVYAGSTLNVQTTGDLNSQNNLAARDSITLNSGGQLTNHGIIEAGVNADNTRNTTGDVSVTAQNVVNSGQSVIASRDLTVTATQTLGNQGGTLSGQRQTSVTAGTLDNQNKGRVLSGGTLGVAVGQLLNAQGGLVHSSGALNGQLGTLSNQAGELSSLDALTVQMTSLDNVAGLVSAGQALHLSSTGALNNQGGQITGLGTLDLQAGTVDNSQGGKIASNQAFILTAASLDNHAGGLLSAIGPLQLDLISAINGGGRISSQSDLDARIAQLNNQQGQLVAAGSLGLSGASLDNRSGGVVSSTKALTLNVDAIDNRAGELSSGADVSLTGSTLDNSNLGKVLATTHLGLTVAQVINQGQGLLSSQGSLLLFGQHLDNGNGQVVTNGDLDIRLDQALGNLKGLISSDGHLNVSAASLDNTGGTLSSGLGLVLSSTGAVLSQGGSITSGDSLTLTSQSLDNSLAGVISGKGASRISTGTLDNRLGGQLTSNATLDLTAGQVSNSNASRIASDGALTASVNGFDQQGGSLGSQTSLSLDLNQGQLNNQGGLINAPLLMLKNLQGVNNQGGEISSAQAFTLAAASLDNSQGKLISNQALTLSIAQALSNLNGKISANGIDSHSGSLDNSHGLISSYGSLGLTADTSMVNQSGLMIGDGAVLLNAASLDNSLGRISGKTDVHGTIASLNNQGGQLIAQGALGLTGTSLDNRLGGLLGSTQGLTLTVDQVDNRGGELSGKTGLSLSGSQLDNSDGGRVVTDQALSLNVGSVLNRNQGLLSAQTGLTLLGGSLDNTTGSLSSQRNLLLTLSADLNNSAGTISSEGLLTVSAASLANRLGSLSSAGQLSLGGLGLLDNQGGRLVTDGGLDLHSASLDNRQQGTISGLGPVLIATGNFDNSHGGFLSSGDHLNLTTAQLTNQDGGRIGAKDLTASVTGLDQQGGSLKGDASLTLDLNHGQLNNQGGLINAPLLVLNNLKGVNNQSGEISSAQAFTLAAESLSNDNGKLLSNQALTLRIDQALSDIKGMIAAASVDAHAGSLDNSGGTLTSRADLGLTVDGQLTNQNLGLINATNNLTLNSAGLNNQGGSLLGSAIALDFGAATGDLNNAAGQITTAGNLTINHLRDLNNQGGVLSSAQNLNLTARTLDNSNAGQLISNNLLSLSADNLINQNAGLLSGWQGVTINAGSLDNRNNATVSSRSGNVAVTLSGALLNSNAGALASQQALTVAAASIDNSNKGILSSGAGQALTVSGLLNNAQGGLIDSGAALTLNAMALTSSGTINAQQALTFTGTDLDNSNGTLSGGAGVTLDLLGTLTNTNGKLSAVGPLLVQRSTQINNQGGQLSSQGLLTLLTGGLDNSNNGTIGSGDKLLITSTGTIQNGNGGLIASRNADLQLSASSLGNGKGSLQGQGAVSLNVSGDIDNQSGQVIAQSGDLTLNAANIDSSGGLLSSISGALQARVVGVLKNGYDLNNNSQGGVLQAQRLDLQAWGGIDNYGGHLVAQTGDAVIATGAGDFDNRNGGVYAKGLVQVTGHNFDNSGDNDGQISGNQIALTLGGALNNRLGIIESGSTLAISAASLDNQTGQLRALGTSGKTEFQIGGLFDNSNGKLETATTDLTLNAGSFLNQGGSLLHLGTGTLDMSTANIFNAGAGNLVTRGGLTLTADSWTNSSVLQVGRLTLNINNLTQTGSGQLLATDSLTGTGGNWNNDGLIASNGSLALNLSGNYSGNGKVSSLGSLGVSAAQIDLGSAAGIMAGSTGLVSSSGSLTNNGRVTAIGDLTVNSANLTNQGTLGSAANLRVNADTLLNQNGLIFSGGDMALRTNNFTNRYADVYSLGNISIAKDDNNGASASINNISSTMESVGDMSLSATHIENRKDVFQTTGGMVSAYIGVRCYACDEFVPAVGYQYDGYLVWIENYTSQIVQDSASASMTAGRNFLASGQEFINQASTVSAGNNLTVNTQTFTNQGASVGDYSVRRSFVPDDIYSSSFWVSVMNYNAANDPIYTDPFGRSTLHEWNASNVESISSVFHWQGGRNGSPYTSYGIVHVDDTSYGGDLDAPHYNPNEPRAAAPAAVQNAAFFENTLTYNTPSTYANAIVQAGGAVNITATQNLTNSVVRQGVSLVGGASRVGSTQVSSLPAPTVVSLNAQLRPDLAQQQVNPITLPGFTLPSGQNGLFRLSGQGSTSASLAPQTWSIGGSSLGVAQRQPVASVTQAQDIGPVNATQLTSSSVDPGSAARQPANISAPAVNLGVSANDPVTQVVPVGALSIPRVLGLPDTSVKSNPQKYLIETNPVLTDLKQFMSSDYLLSNLGYNPDDSAKRLGDGLYEERLIDQAVAARTGQRFIDGQTSDDAEFKYLMDNAISSQKQLNLSYGVGLTNEQVAALTHDIVWMEKEVVDGQEVMVPVLYLAQANNRLAPNGALIEGNDVNLIAGQDLTNSGTLHANNTLSAAAGNDLVNSGLTQAYARLDMLAGNNLTNTAGGVIAGRDVTLTAVSGDVVNDRPVTTAAGSDGYMSSSYAYADAAARIEAANDLTINAGRDVNNAGSLLQAGRDTSITAGRDVNLVAVQTDNKLAGGKDFLADTVTQLTGSVTAGRDLSVSAGRDLSAIASQLDAARDATLSAKENLVLTSAANESHTYSDGNHRIQQADHVAQVAASVSAGGDVRLSAGQDMAVVSSKVTAGNEADLVAGGKLNVLAAQNTDYTLYDKKDSGGWGSSSSRHDEVTQITNVGSEIKAGGDVALISGNDQHYQAAKLTSGKDLTLQSGGNIDFEGVKDLHKEDHAKSDNSLAWTSMSGSGSTDETLKQTEMSAKGQLVIKAVDGLHIDVKQVNEQTVSQAIDAMVQADPQLAWLKDAEKRGDVDWKQIKELHDSYSYSSSSLGEGAMLAIIIIVTVLTAGTASGAIGAMAGTGAEAGSGAALAAGGSEAMMAAGTAVGTASAGWANVALTATLTSLAGTGAVSVINNKGDLGAALGDTFSSNSLKNAAIGGLTAGAISYADSTWFKPAEGATSGGSQVTTLGSVQNPGYTSQMLTWSNAADTVLRSGANAVISSGISTAINGGSFGSNLGSALINEGIDLGAAAGNRGVGDLAQTLGVDQGTATTMMLHAMLGGLISVAKGQDFASGAIAGGVAEGLTPIANGLLAQYVSDKFATGDLSQQGSQDKIATAQIIGLLSASLAGGDAATGSMIGGYGEKYNAQFHVYQVFAEAYARSHPSTQTGGGNPDADSAALDPTSGFGNSGGPGGTPSKNPFSQSSSLLAAALAGGALGEMSAALGLSLEEALASLPTIGRMFSIGESPAPEVIAETPKGGTVVASDSSGAGQTASSASEVSAAENAAMGRPLDWSRVNPLGENAADHVNLHGADNLGKPLQGVFSGDPIETAEAAWKNAQAAGLQPVVQANGNLVYDVPMGKPVGWQGGYNGTGTPLSVVRVVVNKAGQVVTAFPK
ncbi:two-partner secretion domain-containing protein [Pseudomonas gingeri]|uniref:Filamentous hemagglutinin N-terminal domain-containing protein n=1 Tax=Pseudomonas gingeri TaxID=117681 RepID=A0A7Y7WC27_9PSED|nr:filamentous hemagglutinin N-terminal domain-containing protein [Pseudomonas gingeri]NWB46623.1 filamentous hemagglutinin N-terminal domain-containing protein [Pseudomonas gingeri]